MKTTVLTFLVAIALTACKDDNKDNNKEVPEPDRTFAQNAATANTTEIQMSGLVPDRSTNADVKKFASHMIDEHLTALNDLKNLASNRDLTLTYDLDTAHQVLRQKLMGLSGLAFDTVFMNSMVRDHVKAMADFQAESNAGQDDDLKAYANKYLPNLSEHLKAAKALQATLMTPAPAPGTGRKAGE